MDRSSTEKMRLDRRLIRRRNWIPDAELEKELAALPDASEKIAEPEPESEQPSDPEAGPDGPASGEPSASAP